MPQGTFLACSTLMQLGIFDGWPNIDGELLAQEMRSGRNVIVVDVRNKEEFCAGHIDGARWIPIHQLVARACEITADRSASLVVVSRSGTRATLAAAALRLAGYAEVATLIGGMNQWAELALPVSCTTSAEQLLHGATS